MQTGHIDQARQHAEHGQYRKARAAYGKALASAPRDADVLIEFAVLEAQNGQLTAAKRLLDKAHKLVPDEIAVHVNLAEVAVLSERHEAAESHFRRALELDADDADALYGLGNTLRALGQTTEALPYLERAHERSPADAEVLNALAIVLEAERHTGRAMQCYHRAITLSPDYLDAWCNYAQLLYHERRFADAAKTFGGAQKHSPDDLPTNLLLNWAISLSYSGRYDRAFELVDRAIETGDMPAHARFIKGAIRMQHGDFDVAQRDFDEAIALNRDIGEAYEKLARMNKLEIGAAGRLRDILDNESLPESNRTGAGFALYKILDKDGRYDEAFDALAKSNALKAASLEFSGDEHERRMTKSIEVFTPAFFDARKGQGHDTRAPVFVLGMPRSGTTLCEQILAAYPEVKPCGEQQDFQHLAASLAGYPENLADLPPEWAQQQGQRILERMVGDDTQARFATNKSPGNYAYIGLIAWVFPNARVIYCRRDPRDIGLSSFEQNFHAGLSFTYDLEAFGFAYRQHERIMRHWHEVVPLEIHTVEYESLVSDQERVARRMVEFCGLTWRSECLDTARVTRPIETASVWQVRQPINKGSIGKWKRYERHLRPMIEALGLE